MSTLCQHIILTVDSDKSVRYIIVAINIISLLVAAPGNMLTGVVITKFKYLRGEATYLLIGSVCLADALVASITQPLYICALILEPSFSYCGLYETLFVVGWMSSMASILGVNMITIDRFLFIMYPMHYADYMTRRRAILSIIFVWVAAILFGTVSLGWHSTIALHTASLTHTSLSCIFVAVVYARLYKKVAVSNRNTIKSKLARTRKVNITKEHRQRQATKTVVTVVFVFFGCWLPWVILTFIVALEEYKIGIDHIYLQPYVVVIQGFLLTFGFSSSAFNVFIYGLKNTVLKDALKKFLRGKSKNSKHLTIPLKSNFRRKAKLNRETREKKTCIANDDECDKMLSVV